MSNWETLALFSDRSYKNSANESNLIHVGKYVTNFIPESCHDYILFLRKK